MVESTISRWCCCDTCSGTVGVGVLAFAVKRHMIGHVEFWSLLIYPHPCAIVLCNFCRMRVKCGTNGRASCPPCSARLQPSTRTKWCRCRCNAMTKQKLDVPELQHHIDYRWLKCSFVDTVYSRGQGLYSLKPYSFLASRSEVFAVSCAGLTFAARGA
eukprot:5385974-Amphidinium_carterae.1